MGRPRNKHGEPDLLRIADRSLPVTVLLQNLAEFITQAKDVVERWNEAARRGRGRLMVGSEVERYAKDIIFAKLREEDRDKYRQTVYTSLNRAMRAD